MLAALQAPTRFKSVEADGAARAARMLGDTSLSSMQADGISCDETPVLRAIWRDIEANAPPSRSCGLACSRWPKARLTPIAEPVAR